MNSIEIYWVLLIITTLSFLAGEVLSLLNSSVRRSDIDPRVADFYNAEKYCTTLAYQKDTERFNRFSSAFSFILSIGFLAFGGFGWLDRFLSLYIVYSQLRSLCFFGLIFFVSDILSIPFQLYHTFSLEARYGFNKTTAAIFLSDKIKGYILGLVLGGGILYLFIILVETLGSLFWIAFAALMIVITLFLNMFYTSLILPLFNTLTPLPEGELKEGISAYALRTGLELEGIYVMDGSKRSGKSNAFFSGLGPKKKIVLFDTLIQNHSINELIAILAHEAGHLKLKHIPKSFIFSTLQITLTAWIFSWFIGNAELSIALGGSAYALHLNLIAFGILFTPISAVTGLFTVIISRIHEYQADAYGAKTTSVTDMGTALKRLSADNLSSLYPHSLYVFFTYSHPPLLQRIDHLEIIER